jgi:hypothetical protein
MADLCRRIYQYFFRIESECIRSENPLLIKNGSASHQKHANRAVLLIMKYFAYCPRIAMIADRGMLSPDRFGHRVDGWEAEEYSPRGCCTDTNIVCSFGTKVGPAKVAPFGAVANCEIERAAPLDPAAITYRPLLPND